MGLIKIVVSLPSNPHSQPPPLYIFYYIVPDVFDYYYYINNQLLTKTLKKTKNCIRKVGDEGEGLRISIKLITIYNMKTILKFKDDKEYKIFLNDEKMIGYLTFFEMTKKVNDVLIIEIDDNNKDK